MIRLIRILVIQNDEAAPAGFLVKHWSPGGLS